MNNQTTRNTIVKGSVIRQIAQIVQNNEPGELNGITVTAQSSGGFGFTGIAQGELQILHCIPFGEDYRVFFTGTSLFMEFVEAEGFSPALDRLRLYFGFFSNGEPIEEYLSGLANEEIIISDGPALAQDETLVILDASRVYPDDVEDLEADRATMQMASDMGLPHPTTPVEEVVDETPVAEEPAAVNTLEEAKVVARKRKLNVTIIEVGLIAAAAVGIGYLAKKVLGTSE